LPGYIDLPSYPHDLGGKIIEFPVATVNDLADEVSLLALRALALWPNDADHRQNYYSSHYVQFLTRLQARCNGKEATDLLSQEIIRHTPIIGRVLSEDISINKQEKTAQKHLETAITLLLTLLANGVNEHQAVVILIDDSKIDGRRSQLWECWETHRTVTHLGIGLHGAKQHAAENTRLKLQITLALARDAQRFIIEKGHVSENEMWLIPDCWDLSPIREVV
jgi:hypothetical protein